MTLATPLVPHAATRRLSRWLQACTASLAFAQAAILLVASTGPHGTPAAPSQLSVDQTKVLDSARDSALAYTQTLPNFICTQITHRDASGLNRPSGGGAGMTGTGIAPVISFSAGSSDVIEERLTFFNQEEKYEVVTVDGKKVSGVRHSDNRGAISAGEFGSGLHDIFDPESRTEFTWDRIDKLRGRQVYVFGFHVPKESGALVTHGISEQQIVVPYAGLIFVDADTKEVMRITSRLDLPPEYPIKMAERMVDYKPTVIAAKSYNLPSHSEVRMHDESYLYTNRIDFKNYQKFTVETTIHYGSSAEQ